MIDKIIRSLTLLIIGLMEVSLLIATYVIGMLYVTYVSIRGKKDFKKTTKELSKEFINDLKETFIEHKELMLKA